MEELLTPQLFLSLVLILLVILVSLIFRNEDDSSSKIMLEAERKKLSDDYNEKLELEKSKCLEELGKAQKLFDEQLKQANLGKTMVEELKNEIDKLESYSILFESEKLGELNEELKYTAGLIVKKVKQLKQITENRELKV